MVYGVKHTCCAAEITGLRLFEHPAVNHCPIACVADCELPGMVSVTGTEPAVVIVDPGMRTVEIPLLADISAREMILAGIRARHDTGIGTIRKPLRTIDIIKGIND